MTLSRVTYIYPFWLGDDKRNVYNADDEKEI